MCLFHLLRMLISLENKVTTFLILWTYSLTKKFLKKRIPKGLSTTVLLAYKSYDASYVHSLHEIDYEFNPQICCKVILMMLKGLKITLLHIVSVSVSIVPLTKYTLFIHKRHFYKQRQTEIGKNLSKS